MLKIAKAQVAAMLLTGGVLGFMCTPVSAAVRIEGQVPGGRWFTRKLHRNAMGRKFCMTQDRVWASSFTGAIEVQIDHQRRLATLNTLGLLIAACFTVANDDWRARFGLRPNIVWSD